MIREIAGLGGEVSEFVNPLVHQRLLDKLKAVG
jgi:phosphopantetheine adenylyltransferase